MSDTTKYSKLDDQQNIAQDDDKDDERVLEEALAIPLETDQQPLETDPEVPKRKSPLKQLIVVYFVTASDSISLSVIGPFLPDLCRYRFGIPEEYVGIAAGFLMGGFSFATFISSFILGHISDTRGRKPILIMGLVSGCLCTFAFSLAPNFTIAMIVRLIAGFTNANTALVKTVITDITLPGSERTIGFAYMGASFSIARAISSAVGGLATGVVVPGVAVLDDPYFLPCFIGALFNLFGLIFTILVIPETLKKKKESSDGSFFTKLWVGLKEISKDKLMSRLIFVYALNSFSNGALLAAMILLFSLDISYHGLGYTPFENGIVYGWFGLLAAIFQIFFFKKVLGRLSVGRTYTMGSVTLGTATFFLPCSVLLYWFGGVTAVTKAVTWVFLVVCITPLSVGFMTALPVMNTMVSNAADPARVGLSAGVSQSVAGLLRAFGPTLAGVIFSISAAIRFPFLLFWVLTLIYAVCWWMSRRFTAKERSRIEGEVVEVELQDGKIEEED